MTATQSALVVLAPETEPVVGAHRMTLDPSARRGVPAHLTVLFPFVPPATIDDAVLGALRAALAGVAPFTATLTRTGWFTDRVLYLAPEDPTPFVALTAAVVQAFPDQPPYGGRFAEVVPHLTVGEGAPPDTLCTAEADVARHLPITVPVTEVALLVGSAEDDSWRVVHRYGLGPR